MQPGQVISPANEPPVSEEPIPVAKPPKPEKPKKTKSNKRVGVELTIIFIVLFLISLFLGMKFFGPKDSTDDSALNLVSNTTKQSSVAGKSSSKIQGLQLDQAKNYGNKYSNGILPVGDSHYVTTGAKTGYVYACGSYASSLNPANGGAGSRGPWFINNNTQYDLNKKLHVKGSVNWQPSLSNKLSGSIRTISTNDLPSHITGTFPISSTDPAYTYDRNPNSIKSQTLAYSLNASPTYGTPHCMSGEAGVMLTGVALFNAFDAGGRDAGAWEIQDNCSGHPQVSGEYHYHTLSGCIQDVSVKTVLGFALDGFPITGPLVSQNNILTTADLDECHGLTSQIKLDGKNVTAYHYVMTQDFPYSVSCFRSTAVKPPGQQGTPPQN